MTMPFHPERFAILCVEDEPRLRANIAEELRDTGYKVLEAADGMAALTLLDQHRPDLVLCDITMPRMGGYELLRALQSKKSALAATPFVFLTALSDRLAVIEGRSAGADDYLTKPVDFDLMLTTIRARLMQVERVRANMRADADQKRAADIAEALRHGLGDLAKALDHMSVGVVLVDEQHNVVHLNARAERLGKDILALARHRPFSVRTGPAKRLREALATAIDGPGGTSDVIAVERDNGYPLLLQVVALEPKAGGGPRAACLVVDAQAELVVSESVAARVLGLTPAEARVACAIARGKRNEEILGELGISPTTFAFHLRNIFRKTGTNRQQDVVALLARIAVLDG